MAPGRPLLEESSDEEQDSQGAGGQPGARTTAGAYEDRGSLRDSTTGRTEITSGLTATIHGRVFSVALRLRLARGMVVVKS